MIIARNSAYAAKKAALSDKGCVVTIGNFDGVHIGHQAMLFCARAQADQLKLPLLVLSFDPHPEVFFLPSSQTPRLSSLAERSLLLKKAGVDIACFLPFDAKLAALSDVDFVESILIAQCNAKCVVIGDDFHYGKDRLGDVNSLRLAGEQRGEQGEARFETIQIPSVCQNGQRVSSTAIRAYLAAGDFAQAEAALASPYQIMGRVVHGDARGRSWGFPTLNLIMHYPRALKGVFAVSISRLSSAKPEKIYYGVANLGTRPTVGGNKTLLEINVFNYAGDAYGKRVCVRFHLQIRQEQKFDSFDALKAQIKTDKQAALDYFQQS